MENPWKSAVADATGLTRRFGEAMEVNPGLHNEGSTMNTKQAIEQVLSGSRKPMRVPEIIEAGVPLATSLKGKTPGQTFYSTLYAEAKKTDGLVVQVGRGEFKLNPKRKASKAPATKPAAAAKTSARKRGTTTRKRSSSKSTKTVARKRTARKGRA